VTHAPEVEAFNRGTAAGAVVFGSLTEREICVKPPPLTYHTTSTLPVVPVPVRNDPVPRMVANFQKAHLGSLD